MNKKTLIIVLAVIALLLIGGGAYWFGKSQGPGTAAPTPTSPPGTSGTIEPSPTDTATPTPTKKLLPTWTPKPTNTPIATPTITPTPAPGVVNIETSVSPAGTTHSCSSTTFTFSAKIFTNAATTVTYKWLRSDGASGSTQTITFSGAGNQTVTNTWTTSQDDSTHYNGWERL